MTVKELKEYLSAFPDNMEIVEKRYSDTTDMKLDDWSVIDGYRHEQAGYVEYFMKTDGGLHKLVKEGRYRADGFKSYLYFSGN